MVSPYLVNPETVMTFPYLSPCLFQFLFAPPASFPFLPRRFSLLHHRVFHGTLLLPDNIRPNKLLFPVHPSALSYKLALQQRAHLFPEGCSHYLQ